MSIPRFALRIQFVFFSRLPLRNAASTSRTSYLVGDQKRFALGIKYLRPYKRTRSIGSSERVGGCRFIRTKHLARATGFGTGLSSVK